jgi:acetyl esterase/lipase
MPCRFARVAALLVLSIVCAAATSAQTTATPPATPRTSDAFLGTATYRLWDGDAPGSQGAEDADVPTLTVFRVHARTGNGTAIVIAPGGAYRGLAANLEGRQVADWFAARGVTAFVLK